MTTGLNLSDELFQLHIESERDIPTIREDYTPACFTQPLIQSELKKQSSSRLSINMDDSVMRGSFNNSNVVMSSKMHLTFKKIVEKQRNLIDCLKEEANKWRIQSQKLTKEKNALNDKLQFWSSKCSKALELNNPTTNDEALLTAVVTAIDNIKKQLHQSKKNEEFKIPDEPYFRKTHHRTGTVVHREKDQIYKNGKKTQMPTSPRYIERDEAQSLRKEIDELRQEIRKLKDKKPQPQPIVIPAKQSSIPVFVTSPRDRKQIDIRVQKVVDNEKVIQKPVFKTQIKDTTCIDNSKPSGPPIKIVQRIIEKPIEKIVVKEVPIFKEKLITKEIPIVIQKIQKVEVPVERVVQKIVEKVVQITKQVPIFIEKQIQKQKILYVDREIEVEKVVYLNGHGVKMYSKALQTT